MRAAGLLPLMLSLVGCAPGGCLGPAPESGGGSPPGSSAEPERPETPAAPRAKKEAKARQSSSIKSPLEDDGIYPEFDVGVDCPSWLKTGPLLAVGDTRSAHTWLASSGIVVCSAAAQAPRVEPAQSEFDVSIDRDEDGFPDAVDIVRGAKKAALNGAHYASHYRELPFPGGDVPRDEGVCTDVIVRALRNAGYDLQLLLARDIEAHSSAYPMVKKPNPHIDHRRVRTLLPYFERTFRQLPTDPTDTAHPYFPGDIVFMDTMGDAAPEHMAVVSDRLGRSGLPLLINNWTDGTVTKPMDLLDRISVTHRFRVARAIEVQQLHRGLDGVLLRRGLRVPKESSQVLLVTTPLWSSTGGTITRWRRGDASRRFEQIGQPSSVRIGSGGWGSGRGVHEKEDLAPRTKKEGDKRAPAGVFDLGTAFGRSKNSPYTGKGWPYRATNAADVWIDDPGSPDYNTWHTLKPGQLLRFSAERLQMYELGLVVQHNTQDTVRGAGSAIFVHPWKGPATPTVGCTALAKRDLLEILAWLDPNARPVIVQTAGHPL